MTGIATTITFGADSLDNSRFPEMCTLDSRILIVNEHLDVRDRRIIVFDKFNQSYLIIKKRFSCMKGPIIVKVLLSGTTISVIAGRA